MERLHDCYAESLQKLKAKAEADGRPGHAARVAKERRRFQAEQTIAVTPLDEGFPELCLMQAEYLMCVDEIELRGAQSLYALASGCLARLDGLISEPGQSEAAAALKAAIERSAEVREARARFAEDSAAQEEARRGYVAECEDSPCRSTYVLLRGEARLRGYLPGAPEDPIAARLVVRALDRYGTEGAEETRLMILDGVVCSDDAMETRAARAAFRRCVNDPSPRVRNKALGYARGIPRDNALQLLSSLTNHPAGKVREEVGKRLKEVRDECRPLVSP
jgi:hypothetical protein